MKMKELGLEYWASLSENEKNIYEKMDSMSKYFDDMLFKTGSSTYDLVSVRAEDMQDDSWFDTSTSLPEQIEYFSYSFFRVKVKHLKSLGRFNQRNQTLYIDTDNMSDESNLLHEMIHLHEYVITDKLPMIYYDAVFWALYNSLIKRIPNLNDIITSKLHVLTANDIFFSGGQHSLLFLLKSFDLDLQLNYPLGTVYGYGLKEELAEYFQ